ncbi:hypothetical protein BJF83_21870 [Nocardiopsis sp. CNR-923]|uniref:hypothetical protein n=1 Tax=Nocardiopsis sp. CNR-923 TaxID=1904965 RepID=UPI00095EF5DF|nr:hypothetical protein [Nocardiopsis sp. CNR-923]OLT25990.1 hypothetical protein BJF83_21870 [Nocardiopsis sp. CNR-923]
MSTLTHNWFRAAAMAVAPVVFLAVFLYHPYLAGAAPGPETVARAVEADPTRWAAAHLATIGAVALFVLAFQGLRGLLRDAGEQLWSFFAFPLVIVSGVLVAATAGMRLTAAAATQTGVAPLALVEAVRPWALTLLVGGSVAFLLGALAFAAGTFRAGIMGRTMTIVVTVALVVMGLAAELPFFAAYYVIAVAGIVAFWPLAWTAVRAGMAADAESGTEEGDGPTAPRPRAAQEHRGGFRSLGRRRPHAHH